MEYQTIRVSYAGDCAEITLDRPDVKNALNGQMRAELLDAITEASDAARVIVLSGAGDAFCSGRI